MPVLAGPDKSTAPGGKTLPPEVEKAIARVTDLGSVPEVTARIVRVVEDPRTSARDIQAVVQADPALAAKVLKIVNSSFYGLPAQIASLERAILMLGMTAVKNLALASSLSRLLKADAVSERFSARDVWRHCVAVGVCAREMAKAAQSVQPDEAFVAGLMHDVGLIAARQVFPAKLEEVAELCSDSPQNFCATEERIVGADHQAIGGVLAAKWKFPANLRYAIAYHHEPRALQADLQRIPALTYVADVLCCQAKHGFSLTAATQELSDDVLGTAGVRREKIAEIMNDLPARVAEAEQIFTAT